jgi:hypothetical protein
MVHRHLGAEHFSAGEFDITPSSPTKDLPMTGTTVGRGLQCDTTSLSPSQKAEYNWKHCIDMEVSLPNVLRNVGRSATSETS